MVTSSIVWLAWSLSASAGSLPDGMVLNADGITYSKSSAGIPKVRVLQESILTWEYVEPARFPLDAQLGGTSTYVVKTEPPETPYHELLRTRRVDADGNVWEVVKVDVEALRAAVASEDEASAEESKGQDPLEIQDHAFRDPYEGEEVTAEFRSWTSEACEYDWISNSDLWNGESRTLKTYPNYTDRQSAAVQVIYVNPDIEYPDNWEGSVCTGTIIRGNWVLTAAHCVTSDPSAEPVDLDDLVVRRVDQMVVGGGFETLGVDQIIASPNWTYDQAKNDYALLKLSGSWFPGYHDMNLSAASNAVIGNITEPHNLGFPRFNADCDEFAGLYHNYQDELGSYVAGPYLNLKMDGGGGNSGGPIYFCPYGDDNYCGSGEDGNVISVFSQWIVLPYKTHRGPKVPTFRTWAIGVMNSY